MRYAVHIDTRAAREIEAIQLRDRDRVLARIRALANDPRPPGCAKLSGSAGLWRIRAGDYRIIYHIVDDRLVVIVVKVAHRRDVYRGL